MFHRAIRRIDGKADSRQNPFGEDCDSSLTVQLQGICLLTGKREEKSEQSSKTFLRHEFSTRRFSRTIELADGIDADKLSAELHNGVLEVTAPVADSALPRNIEVKGA